MKETALLLGAVLIALGLYSYNFPVQAVAADKNQATNSESTDSGGAKKEEAEADKSYKKGKTSPTALIRLDSVDCL